MSPVIIDLFLFALLIYLYLELKKGRQRVRVLSHFVGAVIHFSVDLACRVAPDDEKRSEKLKGDLWTAYLRAVLERVSVDIERDSRLPQQESFIKHCATLFQGDGFPELYSEFHRYFSDRFHKASECAGKREVT
ncbi:MAG: hypothetical protein ABSF25_21770 [Bryobacteraceae bacterium]|jgi:hypothetical protein